MPLTINCFAQFKLNLMSLFDSALQVQRTRVRLIFETETSLSSQMSCLRNSSLSLAVVYFLFKYKNLKYFFSILPVRSTLLEGKSHISIFMFVIKTYKNQSNVRQ